MRIVIAVFIAQLNDGPRNKATPYLTFSYFVKCGKPDEVAVRNPLSQTTIIKNVICMTLRLMLSTPKLGKSSQEKKLNLKEVRNETL